MRKGKDASSFKELLRHADIKAIFCDIDGTITDEHLKLSVPAIDAIRMLNEAGILTILASGSCWYAVDIFARYIPASSTFIAENGAVIMSRSHFLSPDNNGQFSLAEPEKKTIIGSPIHPKRFFSSFRKKINPEKIALAADMPFRLVEIVLERLFPFVLLKEHLNRDDFEKHIRVIDTKFAYHISPKEINKGHALQIACKDHLFLPLESTLAVGDGSNDIEMLSAAGIGVAVANGDSDLKASADYITEKPFGSGFKEIAEMILKR
ncbi:MAG: HAD-IIB family hydrolase [Candidatus Thorarchaeota archaeon]